MNTKTLLAAAFAAATLVAAHTASAGTPSASSTYKGVTTTSTKAANGDHVVTTTTGRGAPIVTLIAKPTTSISVSNGAGGWAPYSPPAKPAAGPTGISYDKGDGKGLQPYVPAAKPAAGTIMVPGAGGVMVPYVSPAKSNVIASTTYKGVTTTVTSQPILNGAIHTVTTKSGANTLTAVHTFSY